MHNFKPEIVTAKECPYCGKKPEYVDDSIIYGKSYGMMYYCEDCDAYVGVHSDGSKRPLGRLANAELRLEKRKAHFYFDQLWEKAIKQGRSKLEARNSAYDWLCNELDIPRKFTHIAMFDVDLCKRVVVLSKQFCPNKDFRK